MDSILSIIIPSVATIVAAIIGALLPRRLDNIERKKKPIDEKIIEKINKKNDSDVENTIASARHMTDFQFYDWYIKALIIESHQKLSLKANRIINRIYIIFTGGWISLTAVVWITDFFNVLQIPFHVILMVSPFWIMLLATDLILLQHTDRLIQERRNLKIIDH
jgi:hypothetical protein